MERARPSQRSPHGWTAGTANRWLPRLRLPNWSICAPRSPSNHVGSSRKLRNDGDRCEAVKRVLAGASQHVGNARCSNALASTADISGCAMYRGSIVTWSSASVPVDRTCIISTSISALRDAAFLSLHANELVSKVVTCAAAAGTTSSGCGRRGVLSYYVTCGTCNLGEGGGIVAAASDATARFLRRTG
jgi:hypothetical protein